MGSHSEYNRLEHEGFGGSGFEKSGAVGLGRRDLIRRSAALGLISVPVTGFLAACASSGAGGEGKAKAGKKTAKNPLAVNETAQMEFVLFDGGFGKEYAEDA